MVARYVPRQAQAVELARRAFAAGARTSTVRFLTGLDRCALFRYLMFEPGEAPKPGKRPDSPERFLKNATLATMVDASLAYVLYREDRERWPQPAEALLVSYEHYARRRKPMGLNFDRVFYMVCWTDCRWAWAGREPIFRFTTCTVCHCRYLGSPAPVDNHERECPFCRVQARYLRDPWLQSHFPERQYPPVAAALASIMSCVGAAPAESG